MILEGDWRDGKDLIRDDVLATFQYAPENKRLEVFLSVIMKSLLLHAIFFLFQSTRTRIVMSSKDSACWCVECCHYLTKCLHKDDLEAVPNVLARNWRQWYSFVQVCQLFLEMKLLVVFNINVKKNWPKNFNFEWALTGPDSRSNYI